MCFGSFFQNAGSQLCFRFHCTCCFLSWRLSTRQCIFHHTHYFVNKPLSIGQIVFHCTFCCLSWRLSARQCALLSELRVFYLLQLKVVALSPCTNNQRFNVDIMHRSGGEKKSRRLSCVAIVGLYTGEIYAFEVAFSSLRWIFGKVRRFPARVFVESGNQLAHIYPIPYAMVGPQWLGELRRSGRVFSDGLRVRCFPDSFPHYASGQGCTRV